MDGRRRLLTIGQVADRLGVSPQTVRRWADAGLIPSARLPSGQRRFDPDQIEAIVKETTPRSLGAPVGNEEIDSRADKVVQGQGSSK